MKLLKLLFGTPSLVPVKSEILEAEIVDNNVPRVGEKWMFEPEGKGDPFPKKWGYAPVTITGVRDGWVRYDMQTVFKDERMKLDSFVRTYKFHSNG